VEGKSPAIVTVFEHTFFLSDSSVTHTLNTRCLDEQMDIINICM